MKITLIFFLIPRIGDRDLAERATTSSAPQLVFVFLPKLKMNECKLSTSVRTKFAN